MPQGQSSPKEAVETFCFAWDALQLRIPQAMEVAQGCLEYPPEASSGDKGRFVEMLGTILDLESPLFINLVATREKSTAFLLRRGLFSLSFSLGADGKWRLSRQSVGILPDLYAHTMERNRALDDDRNLMVDGLGDPTELLVTFLERATQQDFQGAAQCLDLSGLPADSRRAKGSELARKLAFALQRIPYPHPQNIPVEPKHRPFTYYIANDGTVTGERVHVDGQQDRWQFNRNTVLEIENLYKALKEKPIDPRWIILGRVVPDTAVPGEEATATTNVPEKFASPRALLRGFLETLDQAEHNDSKLEEAAKALDLSDLAPDEATRVGPKLAEKLEVILRKIRPTVSELDNHANAPPVLLGEGNIRARIVKRQDGRWAFSSKTVARIPQMYESLSLAERGQGAHLDGRNSPRETFSTFLRSMNDGQLDKATECLDLTSVPRSARSTLGPLLAQKLKALIDRIDYVYFHELPGEADGPPFLWHRGPLGRIQVGKSMENPERGWQFTRSTVDDLDEAIDRMIALPISKTVAAHSEIHAMPDWLEAPALRLRMAIPNQLRAQAGPLELWQWIGIAVLITLLFLLDKILERLLPALAGRLLHHGTDPAWVRRKMRGTAAFLTMLAGYWLLAWLDFPTPLAALFFSFDEVVLALVGTWAGFGLIDIAIQCMRQIPDTAAEKIRGFQDLMLPFLSRLAKISLLVGSLIYLVACFDDGSLMGRFLAGLGVLGLAVSLAAQDSLKNLFATMLLIGDRSFSVGDLIRVGSTEGTVQSVGFRSTRLKTREDSIVILPNATLAGGTIDNLGLRDHKRIHGTLTLAPPVAPSMLQSLLGRFREWLKIHSERHDSSRAEVKVNGFNERGLELEYTLYTQPKGQDSTRLKEEAALELLQLAQNLDLNIAPKDH
jgi:MscS family membrane protein